MTEQYMHLYDHFLCFLEMVDVQEHIFTYQLVTVVLVAHKETSLSSGTVAKANH